MQDSWHVFLPNILKLCFLTTPPPFNLSHSVHTHVDIIVSDLIPILFSHNSCFDILNLITLGLKLICLHV